MQDIKVQDDVLAIEEVVRGYFDSYALQDQAWLERVVHSQLAKRSLSTTDSGQQRLEQMSALGLLQSSRAYGGGTIPNGARRDVRVLDIYGTIATAVGVTDDFVDYLHLAKINGTWQIVNALWAMQEK
jgi:hypothetical protein